MKNIILSKIQIGKITIINEVQILLNFSLLVNVMSNILISSLKLKLYLIGIIRVIILFLNIIT